jgi:Asp/Glu/hydantoin racemase
MSIRLAYIHTVAGLAAVFKALSDELIPGTDIFHIVDESLLQNTIRANKLSNTTRRRLAGYLVSAEEAGANLVMVTCSSVGPAVDGGRSLVNIPVFRVDQPMADFAVRSGERIGVAATLQTTLDPTSDLIRQRAAEAGKTVRLETKLCEGAFEAVMRGDTARHDAIVAEGLRSLVDKVEVVVLAQASMARVVEALTPEERKVPILSSPRLAVQHLAKVICEWLQDCG